MVLSPRFRRVGNFPRLVVRSRIVASNLSPMTCCAGSNSNSPPAGPPGRRSPESGWCSPTRRYRTTRSTSTAKPFPDLAKLWYESGPKRTIDGLADFLERETAAGRLRVADPARAAWFFTGMIIVHDNMRHLVGLPRSKRSELTEMVSEAAEVFLAAY
jgi:hypothetical protein